MNAEIRVLKAEIEADLEAIGEIYAALDRYSSQLDTEAGRIAVAYYLHNLYNAFENIFRRVARAFGNTLSDEPGWHIGLLQRMRLDIPGVRPRLISPATYDCLDELRRFRHIFRSAYRLELDADRLALVLRKAQALREIYRAELGDFLAFLDGLIAERSL
ncbi:MAG: hypothetical protein RMK65_09365 [Anaerolineae bacterium]|nr:hypothetical protein [Anaerolineae bacterium]MCX8068743.1 hypothetical protein [Anaerolineae bacterium]MDW7992316.1 hypothetical protein [Anaerolineae bacterium]